MLTWLIGTAEDLVRLIRDLEVRLGAVEDFLEGSEGGGDSDEE